MLLVYSVAIYSANTLRSFEQSALGGLTLERSQNRAINVIATATTMHASSFSDDLTLTSAILSSKVRLTLCKNEAELEVTNVGAMHEVIIKQRELH